MYPLHRHGDCIGPRAFVFREHESGKTRKKIPRPSFTGTSLSLHTRHTSLTHTHPHRKNRFQNKMATPPEVIYIIYKTPVPNNLLLLLQQLLDVGYHAVRILLGTVPLDRHALAIHEELGKVPTNVRRSVFRGQFRLEEGIYLAGVGAVDVTLFEPSELVLRAHAEVRLDEIEYFLVGAPFLRSELVARESQQAQSLRTELVV